MTLLLIAVSATVSAGLATSALAQDTNSPSTTTTTISEVNTSAADLPVFGFGKGMMMGEEFGGRPGRHGGFGGSMNNIAVSTEYNQTVNNILANDTDVQKLISEGYNVTAIRPKLTSLIAADGTLTTKASTAVVALQNGTSGFATAKVDITNSKVTEIIIVTRTVIDKSTG